MMYFKPVVKNVSVFCTGMLIAVTLAMAPAPAAAQNGVASDAFVSDFLSVYTTATDKMVQLGNAIPKESYSWRPGEGVRSVKETILHVTSANYFFGSQLGTDVPEGIDPQAIEKSDMSKKEAIDALNKSVDFAQNAIKNMPQEEMNTELTLFGQTFTKRQVVFILGDHAAEHLGQLIAYARMNEIIPPWSRAAN